MFGLPTRSNQDSRTSGGVRIFNQDSSLKRETSLTMYVVVLHDGNDGPISSCVPLVCPRSFFIFMCPPDSWLIQRREGSDQDGDSRKTESHFYEWFFNLLN